MQDATSLSVSILANPVARLCHNYPLALAPLYAVLRSKVMKKQGAIVLGVGGDNSDAAIGSFFDGAIASGYSTDATDDAVQANIVAAGYGKTPDPSLRGRGRAKGRGGHKKLA